LIVSKEARKNAAVTANIREHSPPQIAAVKARRSR
jgi:hypothetical protein